AGPARAPLRRRRARGVRGHAPDARRDRSSLPGAAARGPQCVRELAYGRYVARRARAPVPARRVPRGHDGARCRGRRRERIDYFFVASGFSPLKSTFGVPFSVSGTGYIGASLKLNMPANRFIGKLRTETLYSLTESL